MNRAASMAPDQFVEHYAEAIRTRRIRIGCSFATEQFPADPERSGTLADRALHAAVDEYGVSDIRIGLRWNHLVPDNTAFISYYDRLLETCFDASGVRHLCIDLGPIKTFRWPEVHVPESVLASLASLPPPGAVIEPDSELAQLSFRHYERALGYVGERYNGRTHVSFCFNEAFHSFGPFGWTMSDDYVAALIRLVEESGYFPGAGYVVNSSEGRQLDRIARFFEKLIRADSSFAGRLTSGFDLYPFLPPRTSVPGLQRAFDTARRSWPRVESATIRNIRRAQDPQFGYRIEVTEAQAEPWGVQETVGNSLPCYQHVLAECIDRILNPQQPDSVIRMWGIEYQLERVLTGTGNDANRAILDLTREINAISSA